MSPPKKLRGKIAIDVQRCKGCGLCIAVCPEGQLVQSEHVDHRGIRVAQLMQNASCTGCAFCATICPDLAVTVFRKKGSKRPSSG